MQKQPYWYHEDDEEEQLSHVQNQLHPQHSLRGDEEEGDEGWDEKKEQERKDACVPTRVCRLLLLSPRWRRGLVPRLPALLWARGGSPPRFCTM